MARKTKNRRIVKVVYEDTEVRYVCEERGTDGKWRIMQKYDNSRKLFYNAVFTAYLSAERFINNSYDVRSMNVVGNGANDIESGYQG